MKKKFSVLINKKIKKFNKIIKVESDKSISHRSLLIASQCIGESNIKYILESEDVKNTINCLKKNVPSTVPGIAFLSGGQTELEATKNLNTINKVNDTKFIMTFSYGRALQQSALKYWSKNQEDLENTKKIFDHRSKMNSLSVRAEWSEATESKTAA